MNIRRRHSTVKLGKDDSSSKDSKDSAENSTSQDSQDADIPDIQGGQDDSNQGMQMHLLMMEKPACLEILSRMACMTDHALNYRWRAFSR